MPHFTHYLPPPLVNWADAPPCIATPFGTASPDFFVFTATTLTRDADSTQLARALRYALF